jgi:ATP-dependent Clp protease protease subunit
MHRVITSNISYFEEFYDFPLPIVVNIVDEIDTDTVKEISNKITQAIAAKQPFLPVMINSPGGDVYDSMHCTEILLGAGIPIQTIGMGLIASGAALLFTCGSTRWMAPSARFMVHDVSADMDGNLTGLAMRTEAEEMNHIKETICTRMALNIGRSPDYFSKMLHNHGNVDVYKSAEDCLQENIATHVGVPKLSINVNVTMSLNADERKDDGSTVWSMKKPNEITSRRKSNKRQREENW